MASRKDDDMTTAFIERFHSRDQHLWKKRKESNSYRICLEHQYGGRFIVLEHRYGRRFIVLEHQYGSNDVMWKRSITSRVVWSLVWNVIRHFTHPQRGTRRERLSCRLLSWSEHPAQTYPFLLENRDEIFLSFQKNKSASTRCIF